MTKEELLALLDEAETEEEIATIGRQLLELDPQSPYGKLAIWGTLGYEEALENLDMLREALEEARANVEVRDLPAFMEDDRDSVVYATIMMNLGFTLLSDDKTEEAYEIAKELANFDDEDLFDSRLLLYRCMLDLGLYSEILDSLDADPTESIAGEHARAIALIEIEAPHDEIFDAVNYAISLAPDIPLYIAGIWEMDELDKDTEPEDAEIIQNALYLIDPWCEADARISILGTQAFLFAYLTGRITDKKEIKMLLATYKQYGIIDRVEKAKKNIAAMEIAGSDTDEIDAEALSETANILSDMLEDNK